MTQKGLKNVFFMIKTFFFIQIKRQKKRMEKILLPFATDGQNIIIFSGFFLSVFI